jgi:hypothetical protein
MPPRRRRSPAERARQVILNDVEIGPRYVRLSAADRQTVDELLEGGQYRGARREILRLDELRRLQRRERERERKGIVYLDGVLIDPSLLPLAGHVAIRAHEVREEFSLFAFDYQCHVTIRNPDGHTRTVVTDNLGFDHYATKEEIARAAIRNISGRIDGEIPSSPNTEEFKGSIVEVALLVSRRRVRR